MAATASMRPNWALFCLPSFLLWKRQSPLWGHIGVISLSHNYVHVTDETTSNSWALLSEQIGFPYLNILLYVDRVIKRNCDFSKIKTIIQAAMFSWISDLCWIFSQEKHSFEPPKSSSTLILCSRNFIQNFERYFGTEILKILNFERNGHFEF